MSVPSHDQVVDYLSNLTVMQIAELTKELEGKWGVTAAAAVAAVAAPADGGGAAEEEQTEFDVMLTQIGDKKIAVIKAVRAITGLGLKEAKGLVDACPSAIKEGVSKDEAEQVKAQLEDAGASAEMK